MMPSVFIGSVEAIVAEILEWRGSYSTIEDRPLGQL
jgi:hypothetical protein